MVGDAVLRDRRGAGGTRLADLGELCCPWRILSGADA